MIIEDLKNYLQKCFDADADISDKPECLFSYEYDHEISGNEVQISMLNDYPSERFLDGSDSISSKSIQIVCICRGQKISGEECSSQKSAILYKEKVRKYLDISALNADIPGICDAVRANSDVILPYEKGSEYYVSASRYDIKTQGYYA